MSIARIILRRLTVLYVVLTDQGRHYRIVEFHRSKGEIRMQGRPEPVDLPQWAKKKRKVPVVLVLGGQGIISKEYPKGDPALERIVSRPEEFVFAQKELPEARRLTFMRRKQYEESFAALAGFKLPVVDVRIDSKDDPEGDGWAAAQEFFNESLTVRKLLKPSPENNTLFSLMASKFLLPVLGVVTVALSVNFFVEQNLRKQSEGQQFRLRRLQQNATVRDKQQGQQQQLQNLLCTKISYPYAQIADRIASVIPDGIILTELSIQPMRKKIQENKPLQLDLDRVILRGESATAAPVSILTDTLRKLEIQHSVQLFSLTRGRNERYQFEIDLRL